MGIYKNIGIANWFIQKGIDRGAPLTQMQLQKLMYFAHALSLASGRGPIIRGQFLAWKYGPVLQELYDFTKSWGREGIKNPIHVPDGSPYQLKIPVAPKDDRELMTVLESTWQTFAEYDAHKLSELSHEVGSPWEKAYTKTGAGTVISDTAISDFYRPRVTNG